MSEFVHDRAAILSTGDEVVTGQIQDSNARYLAQQLMDRGILPVEHAAVPDDLETLVATFQRLAAKTPLIVMTGGLGPTEGDLTRPALARALGEPLIEDPDARAALEAYLTGRGRLMNERQARQAQRPRSARCLPNAVGTAPGLFVRFGRTDVVCLPGPPGELRPMFERHALALLRPPAGKAIRTRLVHLVGIPEADAVIRLGDLTKRTPPHGEALVGITASGGVLTLRMRAETDGLPEQAVGALDRAEARVRQTLGDHVLGASEHAGLPALARAVLGELKTRTQTLAVVESCTGGLLGATLTAVPGSSAAFVGGAITYSNELKQRLVGVRAETLASHGAVSVQCATEMAAGGLERFGASHAIGITGIAGPDGGTAEKPVGTVHIALASRTSSTPQIDCRRFVITGDREDIRQRSCTSALVMLHFALAGHEPGRLKLLWEMR